MNLCHLRLHIEKCQPSRKKFAFSSVAHLFLLYLLIQLFFIKMKVFCLNDKNRMLQLVTDVGDYHVIVKEGSVSSKSLTSHLWPFLRSEVVKYFGSPTLEIEENYCSSPTVLEVLKYNQIVSL